MKSTLETICIRITKHCNLKCIHCRAGSSPWEKEYLAFNDMLELFRELIPVGLKHVSISGGEPLVVVNVGQLCRDILDLGLNVTLTTNGTIALSDTDILNKIKRDDRIRFRISIDGDKELHEEIRGAGTFRKAIDRINEIKDWIGWISINTVVLPQTLASLRKLVSRIEHINIDEWAFLSPVISGHAKDLAVDNTLYPQLLVYAESILKENNFRGGVKLWDFANTPNASVLVKSNGDFVLCGVSDYDDILLGNLRTNLDVAYIDQEIEAQKELLSKSYFNWTIW